VAGEEITPGDILLITLPLHDPGGHEQEGTRPAIVAGMPQGPVRYPVVIILPLTTHSGPWAEKNPALYQPLPPGAGGILRASIVLVDQVRAVDIRRVKAYLGTLEAKIFEPIHNSLLKLFTNRIQDEQHL